ncbi:Sporulation kinase E [Thalassoglobus neptunius]|uniref:histidine kinase n=1 Tax=Thalassoglobus neptunius TaxID=1938619 RepID=A0A5C5WP61_9PLAN|nr:HAMP domain-containing sensor histidine kinase [Thalassoglobus neptunius]TWT52210.1 Sporulation kinase E [Thalassoglobus neptunius]
MQQSQPTSEHPTVLEFLESTLPFENARELRIKILNAWKTFRPNSPCALLWKNPFTTTAELLIVDERETPDEMAFPVSDRTASLTASLPESNPVLNELNWIELEVERKSIGFLGLDEPSSSLASSEIVSATARLLAVSQSWENTLTEARLSSLAEYAAAAGHEINNPLAAIKGRTEQLIKGEQHPERQQWLQTIGAQTLRIRDMIGDSMLFARPPAPKFERLNLTELVESAISHFSDEFARRQISLWGNRHKMVPVDGDPLQLTQVVAELTRNSLNAMEESGKLIVDCLPEVIDERPFAILRMIDDGVGFSESERRFCFDPFYSGRQAGRGLGFGLSKAWRIIQMHSGQLILSNQKSDVTEFVISLPSTSE